jgi:predicted ATPase
VKRFILTGAPGSGKTSILRALEKQGYAVVDEAATDVIVAGQANGNGEPWNDRRFTGKIAELQRHWQQQPVPCGTPAQIYDRSPVCTLALACYLGHPVATTLSEEIDRLLRDRVYQRRVFFVRPIGFCEPTAARRISYEGSLAFERLHEAEYRRLGFEITDIPAGGIAQRAAMVGTHIRSWLDPDTSRTCS